MNPSRPRLLAATAALTAGALTLTACGADQVTQTAAAARHQQKTARQVAKQAVTWPLTGLPVPHGVSPRQPHPVLVVKMDNTVDSRPQVGLGKADMVVEELVEGGITRLAAFYYSRIPARVGPVRSMRASDIGVVTPEHGRIVTSGAAPITIQRLHKAGVRFYNQGTPGMSRDYARYSPYNLFDNLQTTAKVAHVKPSRPADYLTWGRPKGFPTGKLAHRAHAIHARFSTGHTTEWVYRGGHYVNTNSNAAAGDQFTAGNVLVLKVPVGVAHYLDPAGNPVPETHLAGGGAAMLFHGGHVVRGVWHKKRLDSHLTLSVGKQTLRVPAGHTWIELVPRDTGSVTYR